MSAFDRSCSLVLQERDEIIPVLALLETAEGHLGARDVLLWVLEVLKLFPKLARHLVQTLYLRVLLYQSLLAPLDILRLVGLSVGEALHGTGVPAEETVEIRADLVALRGLQVVALGASCLEKAGTLLAVTCGLRQFGGSPRAQIAAGLHGVDG